MSQPLAEFVREALSRGVSREEIARGLEQGGWTAREIQSALDAFVDTGLPVPVPRKRVSSSPKEAFLLLVLFATLYTSAFALGSILFDLIDLILPQPNDSVMWRVGKLRAGIASVVVAFPIFLFMCLLIGRETVRNPGQKISPIRRWLTYLTLFVAATAIVCDLIALLISFLGGDVTLRFVLKAAVVGGLALGTFLYYLRDLRRDEVAPSRLAEAPRMGEKLAFGGVITAVVVVLGVALWFTGSPMRARLLAQDRQRVEDLTAIYRCLEQFYWDKGTLPESLDACDISPATFVRQKNDRVTGEPYGYRVVDATHFELEATFALPSAPEEAGATRYRGSQLGPGTESFWNHGSSRQTFRIDVARKERQGSAQK